MIPRCFQATLFLEAILALGVLAWATILYVSVGEIHRGLP